MAFATWLFLLQRLSLMATGTLVFVLPVVALVVDGLWEHELRLGARAYLGIAIVLAGLGVSLLTRRRRPAAMTMPGGRSSRPGLARPRRCSILWIDMRSMPAARAAAEMLPSWCASSCEM